MSENFEKYLAMLTHEVFVINKHGQELFKHLKDFFLNQPLLGNPSVNLDKFGGAAGYLGFRSGERNVFNLIDMLITQHRQNDIEMMKQAEES